MPWQHKRARLNGAPQTEGETLRHVFRANLIFVRVGATLSVHSRTSKPSLGAEGVAAIGIA
eukprot:11459027-Heterocapsa_arctica.AAC.1